MDRLPGFERPYEPRPTSNRVRSKAGATHQATDDHLEPQLEELITAKIYPEEKTRDRRRGR